MRPRAIIRLAFIGSLICWFVLVSSYAFTQSSRFWGKLKPGKFRVGYRDTVIFNPEEYYNFGNYEGAKPSFVSLWFPTNKKAEQPIDFREYLRLPEAKNLQSLTDTIAKRQMASFIKWSVRFNLDLWEAEEINIEKEALANKILSTTIPVYKTRQTPSKRLPTLIYHHGSGGISFENSVLFEFLASHGFVVISAYYHWPVPVVLSKYIQTERQVKDVEFIARFVKTLSFTDPNNLIYVGHSWGGQIGLRLNQKKSPNFKKYLIFDSTLEQAGAEEIRIMHPDLDSILQNHASDFITPTTVITARGQYYENGDPKKKVIQPFPQFMPFQKIDPGRFTFITLKQPLNHGCFTSVEVMRSVFSNEFPQDDYETVNEQFQTYLFLVQLTKSILSESNWNKNDVLIHDQRH